MSNLSQFFLALVDYGHVDHRPFYNHAALGCGICGDTAVRVICSTGGTIHRGRSLKRHRCRPKDPFAPQLCLSTNLCALRRVSRRARVTTHPIIRWKMLDRWLPSPTVQASVKQIKRRMKTKQNETASIRCRRRARAAGLFAVDHPTGARAGQRLVQHSGGAAFAIDRLLGPVVWV